jgi:tetratricopeptide (TPR) repeat protein
METAKAELIIDEPPDSSAPEYWVDRSEDGRAIVKCILESTAQLIVFHGKRGIGKSELLHRWVIPQIPQGCRVFYGNGEDKITSLTERDRGKLGLWNACLQRGIIFLDHFDEFFGLDSDSQAEFRDSLLDLISSGRLRATLVFLIRDESLCKLFSLRSVLPHILDDVNEIQERPKEKVCEAVQRVVSENGLAIEAEAVEQLVHDLEAVTTSGASLSPELLRVVVFTLRHTSDDRIITAKGYRQTKGLDGILESYLAYVLESIKTEAEVEIALAFMEELVLSHRLGTSLDTEEILNRLDVPAEQLHQVIATLEKLGVLVRLRNSLETSDAAKYEIVPERLGKVIEEKLEREQKRYEQVQWILRRDLKVWQEMDAYMVQHHFDRIHSVRSHLRVTLDEARLMLRCALIYEDERTPGASRYWLRRVKDPKAQVHILLAGLFGNNECSRALSVSLLGDFPLPEVRAQLHLVALRDPSPQVREQAVESLDKMKDKALQDSLTQEVLDPRSPYRLTALRALRIFDEAAAVQFLHQIVDSSDDLQLRRKAIEVLGELEATAALDTLLEIALQDKDEEDRRAAALALAALQEPSRLAYLLDRLRSQQRLIRKSKRMLPAVSFLRQGYLFLLAAIVFVADIFLPGLILLSLKRAKLGFVFLTAGLLAFGLSLSGEILSPKLATVALLTRWLVWITSQLTATAIVLRERHKTAERQEAFVRHMAVVLFYFNAATFFLVTPGLAHALTRRPKRGFELFGRAFLGLLLFLVTYSMVPQLGSDLPRTFALEGLWWAYFAVAFFLILSSAALDVWGVFKGTILYSKVRPRLEAVYSEVMKNPQVCRRVFQMVEGNRAEDVRWARTILRHYGTSIDSTLLIETLAKQQRTSFPLVARILTRVKPPAVCNQLLTLWERGNGQLKRKVGSLLRRSPTEESLRVLKQLSQAPGWKSRLGYHWASWHYRFRVWPKPLMLLIALLLPLFSTLAWNGYKSLFEYKPHLLQTLENVEKPDNERKETAHVLAALYPSDAVRHLPPLLSRSSTTKSLKIEVIHSLGMIAQRQTDQENAQSAARALGEALRNRSEDQEVREETLKTLAEAAKASPVRGIHSEAIPYLEGVLLDTRDVGRLRDLAVDALGNIGTAKAINALDQLIRLDESEAEMVPEARGYRRRTTSGENLEVYQRKKKAIESLGNVKPTWHAVADGSDSWLAEIPKEPKTALAALWKLADDDALSKDLRELAGQQRDRFDSAIKMELLVDRKQYREAVQAGQDILEAPDNPARRLRICELLGTALYNQAKEDSRNSRNLRTQAIQYLQEARKQDPGNAESTNLLVRTHVDVADDLRLSKEFGSAQTEIAKALQLNPHDDIAYLVQGAIHLDQGLLDEAVAAFNRALELNPRYVAAQANLALAHYKKGDDELAKAAVLKSIALNPLHGSSYTLLAEILERDQQFQTEAAEFETLHARYPDSIYPALHLAVTYHEHLALENPIYFEKAYELYPKLLQLASGAPLFDVKANFVEASFTTGRFQECYEKGRELLDDQSLPQELRLNLKFLLAASLVFQNRGQEAKLQLKELWDDYRSLPAGFDSTWDHSGTAHFIRQSGLPNPKKDLLLAFLELLQTKKSGDRPIRPSSRLKTLLARLG